MSDKDLKTLFICRYGQTGIHFCIDPTHQYCKLKSTKSKQCDFREVIDFSEYQKISKQLQAKTDECEELREQSKLATPEMFELEQLRRLKEFYNLNGINFSLIKIVEENTALKQDNKILVEALEKISSGEYSCACYQGNCNCSEIAGNALDKVKEE